MIYQKCHRCKHEWEYKGTKANKDYPGFISCPKCRTSVKLNRKEYINNLIEDRDIESFLEENKLYVVKKGEKINMVTKDYVKTKLDELIDSLENDYSKWGDISENVREDTIKDLKILRRKLKEKK